MLINKKIKFAILFFLVFVLSGCQTFGVSDGLKILNDNLGKALNSLGENQASSTFNFFGKSNSTKDKALTSADLSAADKQAIDDWLVKKSLNRYGDAKNALYTGGTPLFDEATGKAIERYDYILNKFPGILEQIKKGD
ncbi:MAG: hypothetical protein PHE24_01365 [Patescibacteria group bacterium]|nr:hypothetical protein [Patescibacteria group bacterium]